MEENKGQVGKRNTNEKYDDKIEEQQNKRKKVINGPVTNGQQRTLTLQGKMKIMTVRREEKAK